MRVAGHQVVAVVVVVLQPQPRERRDLVLQQRRDPQPVGPERIGVLWEGPGELYFLRFAIDELIR